MIVTFVAALVLGGIIALVTEMYRAVVVACALHAIGTLLVAAGAIALTTQTEHVDPTVRRHSRRRASAIPTPY